MSDLKAIGDAVDTVARRLIMCMWEAEKNAGYEVWDDVPDLTNRTFDDVVRRVGDLIGALDPTKAEFDQAYRLLVSQEGQEP